MTEKQTGKSVSEKPGIVEFKPGDIVDVTASTWDGWLCTFVRLEIPFAVVDAVSRTGAAAYTDRCRIIHLKHSENTPTQPQAYTFKQVFGYAMGEKIPDSRVDIPQQTRK